MTTITISENIKQEIAERVVEQAYPGYVSDYMGEWYVVNGSKLMHYQRTAPWTPWADDDAVIAVDDLVNIYGGGDDDNADFWGEDNDELSEAENDEARIVFALDYIPDSYSAADYAARWGN